MAAAGEAGDSLLWERSRSKDLAFFSVRAEAKGVRDWQGCYLRAGVQKNHHWEL